MFYSGIGDEAGKDIASQIEATKALNWNHIELRMVNGINVHDLEDAAFDNVAGALEDNNIQVNCFSSAVANWSCDPLKAEDWHKTQDMLARALTRMERVGCKAIRGMSFAVQKTRSPRNLEIESAVFAKVQHLTKVCAEHGVIYLHENCMNYGGQSFDHSLRLLEAVNMPNFQLLFDTGNPVFTDLRLGAKPYRKQNALEFFRNIQEFIAHIHIKDGIFIAENPNGVFPDVRYTYPGEGDAMVKEILTEVVKSGYNNGITIEPHLAVVFHDNDGSDKSKFLRESFCLYGQKLMQMVDLITQESLKK